MHAAARHATPRLSVLLRSLAGAAPETASGLLLLAVRQAPPPFPCSLLTNQPPDPATGPPRTTTLPTCELEGLLDQLQALKGLRLTRAVHQLKVQQPARRQSMKKEGGGGQGMQTAHMQRRQCVRGQSSCCSRQGQRADKCGVCSTVTCVGRLATGRLQEPLQHPWRRY